MFTCLRKNPKTLKMEMGILSVNHLIRAFDKTGPRGRSSSVCSFEVRWQIIVNSACESNRFLDRIVICGCSFTPKRFPSIKKGIDLWFLFLDNLKSVAGRPLFVFLKTQSDWPLYEGFCVFFHQKYIMRVRCFNFEVFWSILLFIKKIWKTLVLILTKYLLRQL